MNQYLEEIGEVVDTIPDQKIKVKLTRHSSCDKCGACGMGAKPEICFLMDNQIGAKEGDRVLLRMQSGNLYKAAFLVYTVPLIMLILGFVIGNNLAQNFKFNVSVSENFGIFSGFIFMAVTYTTIRYWDRRKNFSSNLQPQLVAIVKP